MLWPTLGAADAQTANVIEQTGPYFVTFTLPSQGEAGGVPSGTEAYYAVDYGDIHVIALDSVLSAHAPGAPMLAWLQDDLTQNIKPWVIALWHDPLYSAGPYPPDTETKLAEIRATVLPILEAGGVDLVLSRHGGSYERSVLLDGHYGTSDTLTGAMMRDPGDGRADGTGAYHKPSRGPAQHEGTVYVVLGGAGQTDPGPLDHPAMVTGAETLGSLVLDIDGNRLDATFLDSTGAVRDWFTLHKGGLARADVATPAPAPTTTTADDPPGAPVAASLQTPDQVGAWGPVMDWNLQAKHMILLPTGNVLVWSTGDNASVWNVMTDSSFTPVPYLPGDLHCAAQATMADGRIVVLGGQGNSTHQGTQVTAFYDAFTNSWSSGAGMNYGRWYGSVTTLSDGRPLATSGDDANSNRVGIPEVYDPATDTWTVLPGADRGTGIGLYPFIYQLPDGRIMEAGPNSRARYLDISGPGAWMNGPRNSFGSSGYAESGCMYRPGKILRVGGGDPAFNNVATIDMNQPDPQFRGSIRISQPMFVDAMP